jgi:hypothetical protein
MRTLLLFLLVVTGCGKKAETPPPPPPVGSGSAAGSGSGSAAGSAAGSGSAAAGPCLPQDASASLADFTATEKAAVFCIKTEEATQCWAIDLATGALTKGAPPSPPAKPYEVKQADGAAQICKTGGGACVTLDLPKLPKSDDAGSYQIAVKPDGKLAVATGGELKQLVVLDAISGKKRKSFKVGHDDYACMGSAAWVGDSIYVTANVCAGPGGQGYVYTPAGKLLGSTTKVNAYGSEPGVQVDGDQWAFTNFGGNGYEVLDVKTGKTIRVVEVNATAPCELCEFFGDASGWAVPPLAKAGGKLITIGTVIGVTDAATGKVEKQLQLPACPAK